MNGETSRASNSFPPLVACFCLVKDNSYKLNRILLGLELLNDLIFPQDNCG